jgi:hypothetical protein
MNLTGELGRDIRYLSRLSDQELSEVCYTRIKYVDDLCNNQTLWKLKSQLRYSNITTKLNKPNIDWQEFYLNLVNSDIKNAILTPVVLTKNAINFFKNTNFGSYKGEPLNENLTEIVGFSNRYNLTLLLINYLKRFKQGNTYNADELRKYFDFEINKLEETHGFNINKFSESQIPYLVRLMIKKNVPINTLQAFHLKFLLEKEYEILKAL